jgi:glycosyltransferase involved in cell wall biosynthesis
VQVSHRLPYPLVDGGKKGIFGFTRGFSQHPQVQSLSLFSLAPLPEREIDLTRLHSLVDHLHVAYKDARNRVGPLLWAQLTSPLPYNMRKYMHGDFLEALVKHLSANPVDVVHFDALHTAHYAAALRERFPRLPMVLREHNVESTIIGRMSLEDPSALKRAIFASQARRLENYEGRMLRHFDRVLAITEVDAGRLRAMWPAVPVSVVPAGTDLPESLPVRVGDATAEPIRLLHIAAMDWLPNQQGLDWFLAEVLPLLDRMGRPFVVDVIGKGTPERFLRGGDPRVKVHGFVDDLAPFLRRGCLAVVPLHVGGGMRVKILDYMAQGVPVVATPVGAEGISDGSDGVVRVAAGPAEFARAVTDLVADPMAAERQRQAAFEFVRGRYGWDRVVDGVVRDYASLVGGTG